MPAPRRLDVLSGKPGGVQGVVAGDGGRIWDVQQHHGFVNGRAVVWVATIRGEHKEHLHRLDLATNTWVHNRENLSDEIVEKHPPAAVAGDTVAAHEGVLIEDSLALRDAGLLIKFSLCCIQSAFSELYRAA